MATVGAWDVTKEQAVPAANSAHEDFLSVQTPEPEPEPDSDSETTGAIVASRRPRSPAPPAAAAAAKVGRSQFRFEDIKVDADADEPGRAPSAPLRLSSGGGGDGGYDDDSSAMGDVSYGAADPAGGTTAAAAATAAASRKSRTTPLDRLTLLPEVRPVPWRPGVGDVQESGGDQRQKQIRGAILLSTRGGRVPVACTRCAAGLGKFAECIMHPDFFRGSCATCVFTGSARDCTVRIESTQLTPRRRKYNFDNINNPTSLPDTPSTYVSPSPHNGHNPASFSLNPAHASVAAPGQPGRPGPHSRSSSSTDRRNNAFRRVTEPLPPILSRKRSISEVLTGADANGDDNNDDGRRRDRYSPFKQQQHPPPPPLPSSSSSAHHLPHQQEQQYQSWQAHRHYAPPASLPSSAAAATATAAAAGAATTIAAATRPPERNASPFPRDPPHPGVAATASSAGPTPPPPPPPQSQSQQPQQQKQPRLPSITSSSFVRGPSAELQQPQQYASQQQQFHHGLLPPLIDTLPKTKQRQIYGLLSGLQGGISNLQRELEALKAALGIDGEEP